MNFIVLLICISSAHNPGVITNNSDPIKNYGIQRTLFEPKLNVENFISRAGFYYTLRSYCILYICMYLYIYTYIYTIIISILQWKSPLVDSCGVIYWFQMCLHFVDKSLVKKYLKIKDVNRWETLNIENLKNL